MRFHRDHDSLEHRVHGIFDLLVPKSNDQHSLLSERVIAFLVGFGLPLVNRPIHLDYDPGFPAEEVGYVRTDGMLASKTCSV